MGTSHRSQNRTVPSRCIHTTSKNRAVYTGWKTAVTELPIVGTRALNTKCAGCCVLWLQTQLDDVRTSLDAGLDHFNGSQDPRTSFSVTSVVVLSSDLGQDTPADFFRAGNISGSYGGVDCGMLRRAVTEIERCFGGFYCLHQQSGYIASSV